MASIRDQLKKKLKAVKEDFTKLEKTVTKKDAVAIAERVVEQMKALIVVGKSPIKSSGRFPAYKRAGDKDGYPANQRSSFPSKRNRPVNLTLSGEFLGDLQGGYEFKSGGVVPKVGYRTPLSRLKEKGHAQGAGGQPKRQTIPDTPKEFTAAIFEEVVEAYKEIIAKSFKKKR